MLPIGIYRLLGRPWDALSPLPQSGAYALILNVRRRLRLQTGVHGRIELPPGVYLYAGRATRNLPSRIQRHQSRAKKIFWHIDRLTAHPGVRLESIFIFPRKPQHECEIVRACLATSGVRVPVVKFGASDCRNGCPAHLLWMDILKNR